MENDYKPVTFGNWLITLALALIPILNVVMLLVWSISSGTHPSKKNFARAGLLFVPVILAIGLYTVFATTLILTSE